MAKVTPEEYVKKLEKGIENAGEDFRRGVERSEDWEANYSSEEAQTAMVEGLREAIEAGRPVAGAQKLGLEGWRAITVEKASAYTGSAKRAAENAAAKAAVVIEAGEAARQAAAEVKGPKTEETAVEKFKAAYRARKAVWDAYYAAQPYEA